MRFRQKMKQKLRKTGALIGALAIAAGGTCFKPLPAKAVSWPTSQQIYETAHARLVEMMSYTGGSPYVYYGSCTGGLGEMLAAVDRKYGTDFGPNIEYRTGAGGYDAAYNTQAVKENFDKYANASFIGEFYSDADLNASDAQSGDFFVMKDTGNIHASGHVGMLRRQNGIVYTENVSSYGEQGAYYNIPSYYVADEVKKSTWPIWVYRLGKARKNISVSLSKHSNDPSISDTGNCYSLAGAVYGVYSDAACTNEIGTITTDAKGQGSWSGQTDNGTSAVYVKEKTASPGFRLDEEIHTASFDGSNDASASVVSAETPKEDPVKMEIRKINQDDAVVTSPVSLEGAEFTICYFNDVYNSVEETNGHTPLKTWVLAARKAEDGTYIAGFDDAHKVSGDAFFLNKHNVPTLPLGTITIQETKAPKGYTLKHSYMVANDNNGQAVLVSGNTKEEAAVVIAHMGPADDMYTIGSVSALNQSITVKDDETRIGSLTIEKLDKENGSQPQGNAENLAAKFRIRNNNAYDVSLKDRKENVYTASAGQYFNYEITLQDNGYWTSADDFIRFLPYGNYTIEETQAPEGYLMDGNRTKDITIDDADQDAVIHLSRTGNEDHAFYDSVIRGGFHLQKFNKDMLQMTKKPQAEGDGSLQIRFNLYNRSKNPVKVNGQMYPADSVILSDVTKADGSYTSASDLLPYGSYEIEEIQEPEGFIGKELLHAKFDITENGEIADTGFDLSNGDVIRAGFEIQKYGNDRGSVPEGNADLTMQAEIINRSAYPVVVNGTWCDPGKPVFTFTTNEEGYYKSADNLLPYGTYEVKEIKAPAGFDLNPNADQIFKVRENGKIYDLVSSHDFTNVIWRGGFELQKNDMETGTRIQGDGNLQISFALINLSSRKKSDGSVVQQPVFVNGRKYEYGETVFSDHTDEKGYYRSSADLLPYGTYKLIETAKPLGYTAKGNLKVTFTIDQKGMIADLKTQITNRPVLSYWTLEKCLTDDKYDNESDWTKPEKGAKFTAFLKKYIPDADHDGQISYDEFMNFFNTVDIDHDGMISDEEAEKAGMTKREFASVVTDTTGHASSQNHMSVFGTYVIAQVYSADPEISMPQETQEFQIRETDDFEADGNRPAIHYHVNNRPKSYYLQLEKTDGDTKKTVSLNSAVFKIYQLTDNTGKAVNKYVEQKVGRSHYDTFMTTSLREDEKRSQPLNGLKSLFAKKNVFYDVHDEDHPYGMVTTPLKLSPGTYRIDELSAPDGYVKPEKGTIITIGSAYAKEDEDKDEVVHYDFADKRITGSLDLQKKLEEYQADKSLINRDDLSAITFQLIAKEDVIDPSDGSVLIHQGEMVTDIYGKEVSPFHVDANGFAKLIELPLGNYALSEIEVPDGILLSKDVYDVSFQQKQDDQTTSVYYQVFKDEKGSDHPSILNEVTKTEISKSDLSDEEEVPGAKMSLYDADEKLIDTWVSSDQPHTIEGLKAGQKYVLKEENAPDGYYYAEEVPFEINSDGKVQKIDMKDALIRYQIAKIDEEGNYVKGVRLTLTDITDQNKPEEIELPDKGITSDKPFELNGVLKADHTYELKEEEWPDGLYQAQTMQFTVNHTGNGEAVIVAMKDLHTGLSVRKADDAGHPVAGARLQILQKAEDGSESLIHEFISDDKPEGYDISAFVRGGESYILREAETPDGYETAADIAFKVTGTKQIPQEIIMNDKRKETDVWISKIDAATSKELPGAELTVSDENGVVIEKWISADTPKQIRLKIGGTYTLREVTAPEGYAKAESIQFTVTGNHETQQKVVMKDAREIADTSDTSHIFINLAALSAGLGAAVYLGLVRRRI